MLNTKEEIDALIVSYLNGEAHPEEAIQLEDWKHETPENASYYLELEKIHASTYRTKPYTSNSHANAWKIIEHELTRSARVVPLWRRPFIISSVAAAIVAVFLVTYFFTNDLSTPISEREKDPQKGELQQGNTLYASNSVSFFTLNDNSKVTLQPGSKLTIPKGFNSKNRQLRLYGSGSFEVVHDAKNPFILSVGDLQIHDLGTVFHVKQSGDTVKVSVDEGIVELKISGQQLVLEKGDSAFYLVSRKVIHEYGTPRARKDVVFEFDGTNLQEVTEILGGFFKRKIEIKNPSLASCTLSVTFKNEELATILDIIAELLDLRIVQNQNTIEIYGESCQ